MAAKPVSPPSKAPHSKAPYSKAPLSVGPMSVGPVSQFPGTSGRSPAKPKKPPMALAVKLRAMGAALLLALVGALVLMFMGQQHSHQALERQTALADMRLMAQGLGRAAVLAVAGQSAGFAQLREARDHFPRQLERLGEEDGGQQDLALAWQSVEKHMATLQSQEKHLLAVGRVAAVFDGQGSPLLDLAEQLLATQKKTGGQPREVEAGLQAVTLAARITRNAGLLLTSDPVRQELAAQLDMDGVALGKLMETLKNGSDSPRLGPLSQPDQRTQVLALDKAFQDYQTAATSLLGNLQALTSARQAGAQLQKGADGLTTLAQRLSQSAQGGEEEAFSFGTLAMTLVGLALLLGLGMAALYQKDDAQRQQALKAQKESLEKANKQNQEAILRLMDELGNLANGDLTVKATVNEDITGAIADSVNYTVEEFRGTVQRINQASGRVAEASAGAAGISTRLLEAAREQATQIQQAGVSALEMAQSMNHVSADANRSAHVARKSLQVAQKGTLAVQDAMKGMNSIREQIQETSKRIKRLGDSSLEIGEIVEMISDITEQTHVLALNAAIQAAAAGEAGRGFTVVAEEVQRLAERSGDATRQIADIVKTIQADTRNAVAAMERSTADVVEGTRLSDAAGQALAEVGDVSSQMAGMIDSISLATQKQANTATQVALRMKDILQITESTTAGTQQSAQAVVQLDGLVAELKGSVAGFKV